MRSEGGEPAGPTYDRWLSVATAAVLLLAVAMLVRDRVLPAWRAMRVVEVGERVPDGLELVALASGDTMRLAALRPTLLLHFQSGCPACRRNLPAWQRLVDGRPPGLRALASGLEPAASALAYAREHLPRALAVRPADRDHAVHLLGLTAVPTTQLISGGGELLWSRSGVLSDADVAGVLRRARRALSSGSDPDADEPRNSSSGRRP